ncbi:hypothetical protein FA95DRAFT_637805 [Auriscalpium vulgare]|uniref:Uncharacterized protein n=1 Tax=Auriscalpium vulgare TaxID=40419 RepID=A0ACB8RDB9_9AGAM|nr:hypothetical protein FA95DRAFT_637805 [Auriscalpium vulgare]
MATVELSGSIIELSTQAPQTNSPATPEQGPGSPSHRPANVRTPRDGVLFDVQPTPETLRGTRIQRRLSQITEEDGYDSTISVASSLSPTRTTVIHSSAVPPARGPIGIHTHSHSTPWDSDLLRHIRDFLAETVTIRMRLRVKTNSRPSSRVSCGRH